MAYKKTEYSEKLKNPKWQKKRLEILNRDNFACVWCKENEITLHVHHKFYEKGKDPWEYEEWALITICENCHTEEHEKRYEVEKEFCKALKIIGLSALELEMFGDNLAPWVKNPLAKKVLSRAIDFLMIEPSEDLIKFLDKTFDSCTKGEMQ